MDNLQDHLIKLFDFVNSNHNNSYQDSKQFLLQLSSQTIKVVELNENQVFIEHSTPIDFIFILVNGMTYVVNYTFDGKRIIADSFNDVQIFGLIEALNNDPFYKGTVITLSKSLLIKINKKDFLEAIHNNLKLSKFVMKYLAYFSTHSIQLTEYKTAISPYEKLILYIYNKGIGKNLPIRIKDNKSFIADSLQINTRTLYRYLNKLIEDELIERDQQDIILNSKQFKKIEKMVNTMHNT